MFSIRGNILECYDFIQGTRMKSNRLREIRIKEGVTITELARVSKVSQKVISETERHLRDPRLEIKHRILKGLNEIRGQSNPPYSFEDIFPDELAAPLRKE